ncbi:MAG: glycosyltransferase family 39 protein [Candidatus Rokubacteria bacterium]|nr:glycosyltransferase family 39 protein [Candidatus Rokubacteria bacterium]
MTTHGHMEEIDLSSADAAPSAGFWCALLGSALALRLLIAYVVLGDMPLVSDAESYSLEAVALLDHFPGTQAYFWPPGMPYLLASVYALLGSELWVSRLVACTLGTAQVALSTALAREALGDPRGVRAAGWLAALYPPAVLMSGQTYSQHLAGVSLTALAVCAIRLWRTSRPAAGGAAGTAWGIGCITRPSMLSAGPALLMLGALGWLRERRTGEPPSAWGRRLGAAMLGLGLAAAIAVPIVRHNERHGAGATLSTNNEANFFYGNNPYTPHYKTSHFGQREPSQLDPAVRDYLARFRSAPDPRAAMKAEALRYIREHPGITAWRTANRIRAFWGFDYLMARHVQLNLELGTGWLLALTAVEAGGYALVLSLALVTLLCGWGELRRPAALAALVAAFAYQAPYALAFSGGTYHFPVMGLLFPFAGLAAARDLRNEQPWVRARSSRSFWVTLSTFVAIQFEYAYYTFAWM